MSAWPRSFVAFNIGGNKYRLICRVRYATQKVFVLTVMAHGEYDEDTWKGAKLRGLGG